MNRFAPIAIIGQGCVLPGALDPKRLWEIVSRKEQVIEPASPSYWGVDSQTVITAPDSPRPDTAWTDRGGYVKGFDAVFDAAGFHWPAEDLSGLDLAFKWVLHAGREALRSAGYDLERPFEQAGIVLGNKSYPTHSLANYAEEIWRRENGWPSNGEVDPRNRFMSGLPAHVLARALGFGGGAFSLDVACASSLYAIKLACDRLHRGTADMMIAGGINRADDLFLHIGFSALQALSRSGQSRPFHRGADGLLPSEGAAVVVLKRLEDAIEAGDPILGVIRGVGLSNDGRSRGLLTPSEEGQVRCMRRAYEWSGLTPSDLSLVECHAAGTALGDATEVRSMSRIFTDLDAQLPIASLKSNLGHLITVSGVAGLLKVLGAMKHQTRPATLNADDVIDELQDGAFRVLVEPEPWECDGLRRAAINNFGFGGNNAHLIVEEWQPGADSPASAAAFLAADAVTESANQPADQSPIAIVAIATVAADGRDRHDFARALLYGETRLQDGENGREGRAEEITLDLKKVRFPPLDLKQTLPQQLMILEATLQLSNTIDALPRDTTGILLGMQCDAEIARYLVRWRLGAALHTDGGADHREGLIEALGAAGVLGTMPNLITNRLNSQFDLAGPSLTVSGEEISGMIALELAVDGLRRGDLDAAVVGAVDLSCEPVHRAAAAAVLPTERHVPGDAAVVMVLKRLEDAQRDGDTVLAVLPPSRFAETTDAAWQTPDLTPLFGHAHSASGLLRVAAAVEACSRRTRPAVGDALPMPWLPDHGRRRAAVTMNTIAGQTATIAVEALPGPAPDPFIEGEPPTIEVYGGASIAEVRQALERGEQSDAGPLRLVICAFGSAERDERRQAALAALTADTQTTAFARLSAGVYLGDGSLGGETSFVFTGPAGSYHGMGRELVLAMPHLADAFAERCLAVDRAAGWIYSPPTGDEPGPGEKLWGASFLCQIHAALTRDILGIKPEAAIGFCAGETNALFAMGAWNDFDGLYEDLEREGIFDRHLGGDFDTVRAAWNLAPTEEARWQTWRMLADIDRVQAALQDEERCYLTIINAPGDLVIGGDPDACKRVIERAGAQKTASLMEYNIAIHSAATKPIEPLWYELHHRPTQAVPGVRFYTHSTLDHYMVDADRVADALVGQALGCVDFPQMIRRAWDDGVRVFIEHGPRAGCTRWIGRILGDRPHLAVSLDRTGRSSLAQAVDTTARLLAAGVPVNHRSFIESLSHAQPLAPPEDRATTKSPGAVHFPAHLPAVKLQSSEPRREHVTTTNITRMPLPPLLPPVSAPVPRPKSENARPHGTDADLGISRPRGTEAGIMPRRVSEIENARPHGTAADLVNASPHAAMPSFTDPQIDSPPLGIEAEVAAVHNEFLRERTELHLQFMKQRQESALWFLKMCQNGPAEPAPQPWTAPPAPAPELVAMVSLSAATAKEDLIGNRKSEIGKQLPTTTDPRPGPTFDRRDLEIHATAKISQIFGPLFAQQDDYPRQVRMPAPPLLLVDRVTGIAAEPGAMEDTGIIWTETDGDPDAWYMHRGRMPVGIMVEAGQADLMLISWMGADANNRGARVYRLLGCELTFHGPLPGPTERLEYEIHIDGHVRQGGVHLFFFHYDCTINGELRLSMRHGQAGFFTDAELANSEGVLWSPTDIAAPHSPANQTPAPEPVVTPEARRFGPEQLRAFADGRAHECFGKGFERTRVHIATPTIQSGPMAFLDSVEDLDPRGGPHQRGYLRAVQKISPDTWFFGGHFKGDPCMPGTLMLEGCIQAMSFYFAALGYTLERDGWRFEPIPEQACTMRCRGQVTPASKEVVYELFVREIIDGPQPELYADLLCSVDGLKAFHCERLGLRLVPDWPLQWHPEWVDGVAIHDQRPVATIDGFSYDDASVMACCLGRPSDAFGPMYLPFDGPRRAPRLPNPPYLFVSRIAEIDAQPGVMKRGARVVAEYDVPIDAWYFDADSSGPKTPAMPFSCLMEVGLQPCGWLASFIGCALSTDRELFFRNLDGTSTVHGEVMPQTSVLRTESTLTSLSRSGAMIIVAFAVQTFADDELIFEMDTVFGFFPAAALLQQEGLATTDEQRRRLHEDAPQGPPPPALLALPEGPLSMIDRITGWWPDGGESGLGRIRSEQDVDAGAWYFRAHFFQDPVQPGSLGVEAMLQLLRVHMRAAGMHESIPGASFVPILTGRETTWKYRGQVVPENQHVRIDMEILERSEPGAPQPYAIARASLWVDDTRIYEVTDLGMKIVPGDLPSVEHGEAHEESFTLDPETDTWLKDHRPTFTRPALPMMSIADYLASAVAEHTGGAVVELRDVHLRGWVVVDGPLQLTSRVWPLSDAPGWYEATLAAAGKPVASGRVRCSPQWPTAPAALPELSGAQQMPDPYPNGALFHGPAFQLLESGHIGDTGSRAILEASAGSVPIGALHPALLDAALHVIPHDDLQRWSAEIAPDTVAYPHRIDYLTLHGPTPRTGKVRVEARLIGFAAESDRFPTFRIQFFAGDQLWAEMQLVELLFPKGRIAAGEPERRRAFLRDATYVPGLGVARLIGDTTRLSIPEFRRNDWFEGTIAAVYDVHGDLAEQTRNVAIKDHLARRLEVHPSQIKVDGNTATCSTHPWTTFAVKVEMQGAMEFVISDT